MTPFSLDAKTPMAHNPTTTLTTVAETAPFIRQAAKLWTEDDRNAFVDYIAANPDAGDVIPDTGGLRKVRWGQPGIGKRGGVPDRLLLPRRHDAALFAADVRKDPAGKLDRGREAAGASAHRKHQADLPETLGP
jgi:hypothetical protein